MIEEDYVSFETAKLLKEKGYKGSFNGYYNNAGCVVDKPNTLLKEPEYQYYERVSLYMAMKWLRKVHKIFFNVNYYNLDVGNEWLQLRINRPNKIGCEVSFEGFGLEEQYEKAIKYCLENLI